MENILWALNVSEMDVGSFEKGVVVGFGAVEDETGNVTDHGVVVECAVKLLTLL